VASWSTVPPPPDTLLHVRIHLPKQRVVWVERIWKTGNDSRATQAVPSALQPDRPPAMAFETQRARMPIHSPLQPRYLSSARVVADSSTLYYDLDFRLCRHGSLRVGSEDDGLHSHSKLMFRVWKHAKCASIRVGVCGKPQLYQVVMGRNARREEADEPGIVHAAALTTVLLRVVKSRMRIPCRGDSGSISLR
jgi:hypothetical protein